MGRFDQYGLNTTDVAEYIPWGGIVRPYIMKQKNHSLLAVIAYNPFSLDLNTQDIESLTTWGFRRGWVLWAEHQHIAGGASMDYLCICWNPFISSNSRFIKNALTSKIRKDKSIDYFDEVIKKILEELQKFTEAEFLEYQDLMDMLSFTLAQGMDRQEMPKIPLYMDALLTGSLDFDFGNNDITISGKRVYAVTMLAPEPVEELYKKFVNISFRHTRRLLCFGEKESKKDLMRYTQTWFAGRKVLKNVALDGILKRYNGYYMDAFIFLLDEDTENFVEYMEHTLDDREMNYIPESYFLKEVFWGSIPGLYWANTKPPQVGFDLLSEFLTGANVIEVDLNRNILEEAENNLIPTTVNIDDYFSISDDADLHKEVNT